MIKGQRFSVLDLFRMPFYTFYFIFPFKALFLKNQNL
jgi:hypothetical protein